MPVLTAAQEQVISLLAAGATFSAAAQSAGVHRNTIAQWRRTVPAFAQSLASAQYDRALHWRDLAEEQTALAISALRDLLADPKTPPATRLKAALAVLKESTTPPPAPPAVVSEEVATLPADAAPPEAPYTPEEIEILHNLALQDAQQASIPPETFRRTTPKFGRNDACPCGSGQKYKRCCLVAPHQPLRATA